MKKIKALKRERVNRALECVFDYPLTIVEAPIGYGKTTAVREFLADKGNPVLWLSFLSEEDTVSFFWDKFTEEIGKLDRAAGNRLRKLGFPFDAPQTATILSILSNMSYEEDTVFVIDDFHLVKGPQIGKLLCQIVREQPDNLHIAVITRDTTNLDIIELSLKGRCYILPQQTLRFTDGEMADYCTLMGFATSKDELKKVYEYTGGWISLVYLTLSGMEQGIPVGRNSAVNELVEKVLYNVYGKRIRQFLSRLSVLDGFTPEEARYVTQEARTGELLKKLRRENAFIAFDEVAGVYKIHNILLDFLRMRQQDVTGRAGLYKRMGEWRLARKSYVSACEYLYRAGEAERVLALLDNEDTITNNSAEFEGVFELFATQPRELLFKYPLAYLQYISMLLMSGVPDAALDGVARLNELQEVCRGMEDIHPDRKNRILAEINIIRIFAVFNDAGQMVACTDEALRLLDGGVSCLIKRESEFTFGSPHFLYSYYREPGKLKETADFMVSCFPAFSRLASGCGTGCEYVTLAEYALETGDMQSAELNALKAIYKAKMKEQVSIAICASLTLIRLYIHQGKANEARELLSQLRGDVAKENNAVYNTTLELVEGYVYGCLCRLDDIPLWLRTGDMSPARFMYQGMAFNYIVYGKAVLLSKNYIALEMLTGEFAQHFSIFHNQLGFLHNKVLEAAAKYRLYGMETGCASLKQALGMAREDHIILPFAEYAPAILDMIGYIAHTNTRDGYIKEVLLACTQYAESLKSTVQSAVSLSRRELEILALAAEGLKRDEIAGRLGISTGTVRTHLQNAYQKLEVSGKTAALKKVEKLKLF